MEGERGVGAEGGDRGVSQAWGWGARVWWGREQQQQQQPFGLLERLIPNMRNSLQFDSTLSLKPRPASVRA